MKQLALRELSKSTCPSIHTTSCECSRRKQASNRRRTSAAWRAYSPSGSRLKVLMRRSRLSTSDSMLRATPGYCATGERLTLKLAPAHILDAARDARVLRRRRRGCTMCEPQHSCCRDRTGDACSTYPRLPINADRVHHKKTSSMKLEATDHPVLETGLLN